MRVDDFQKEMLHQIETDYEKNTPEYEQIEKRFMDQLDAEHGHLATIESDENDSRVNHKINMKKNEMLATVR